MPKKYIPKKFSPHIYPEWGELYKELPNDQKAEILMGITMFPDYEVKNSIVWPFIKSQLQDQYDSFCERCRINGEVSKNYWNKKGERTISNDIERTPNDNEGSPKYKLEQEQELERGNIKEEVNSTQEDFEKRKELAKKIGGLIKRVPKSPYDYK